MAKDYSKKHARRLISIIQKLPENADVRLQACVETLLNGILKSEYGIKVAEDAYDCGGSVEIKDRKSVIKYLEHVRDGRILSSDGFSAVSFFEDGESAAFGFPHDGSRIEYDGCDFLNSEQKKYIHGFKIDYEGMMKASDKYCKKCKKDDCLGKYLI